MINPGELVDLMVTRLRAIPEITSVFSDASQIKAYHHQFAAHTQWIRELTGSDPGMVVRWAGTVPANGRPFEHLYEIAVRVPETEETDGPRLAIYSVWTGFINGKPGGAGGCCDRNWITPLTNDVQLMRNPSMRPITGAQSGQDYWLISYAIPEKGDTCA